MGFAMEGMMQKRIEKNQMVLVISDRGPVYGRVTETLNYGWLTGTSATKYHGPSADYTMGWRYTVNHRPYPQAQVHSIK
jgi:hypothetical protein